MNELWNDFERFWATNDHWIWIVLGAALTIIVVALVVGFIQAKGEGVEHGRRYASTHRH